MSDEPEVTERIRNLNDRFRRDGYHSGVPGTIVITVGVEALPTDDRVKIIQRIRDFEDFPEENDPYSEHDFGALVYNGKKLFWKIDYYGDSSGSTGSEDPSDQTKTHRVLTIMLAEEY